MIYADGPISTISNPKINKILIQGHACIKREIKRHGKLPQSKSVIQISNVSQSKLRFPVRFSDSSEFSLKLCGLPKSLHRSTERQGVAPNQRRGAQQTIKRTWNTIYFSKSRKWKINLTHCAHMRLDTLRLVCKVGEYHAALHIQELAVNYESRSLEWHLIRRLTSRSIPQPSGQQTSGKIQVLELRMKSWPSP